MLNRSASNDAAVPRGPGAITIAPPQKTPTRTHPRLWAAWVLSGDPGDLSALTRSVELASANAAAVAAQESTPSASKGSLVLRTFGYVLGGFLVVLVIAGVLWIRRRQHAK